MFGQIDFFSSAQIQSVSKRSMWDWYKNTILLRAFPEVDKKSLSSQRFWDNQQRLFDIFNMESFL